MFRNSGSLLNETWLIEASRQHLFPSAREQGTRAVLDPQNHLQIHLPAASENDNVGGVPPRTSHRCCCISVEDDEEYRKLC